MNVKHEMIYQDLKNKNQIINYSECLLLCNEVWYRWYEIFIMSLKVYFDNECLIADPLFKHYIQIIIENV